MVTPSFNYGRYLGACLESVRAQRYSRIEHIVLDACSSDGSADVVRSFLGRYDLRAVFETDRGQADALNRGFGRAQGEVLCWLNADDYWLHESVVEEAVAALRAGADVVTAGGRYVDAGGAVLGRFREPAARAVQELRYRDTLFQPATFWRREVHVQVDEALHYAFDWKLWLEMLRGGAKVVALDREWAAYRMHGVNKTAEDPARRREEIAAILGAQFGPGSAQHRWARLVFRGYRYAEERDVPGLKAVIRLANGAMSRLTGRRVLSC